MGSTPLQLLFRVKILLAMPTIFTGIRSMTTLTIVLAGIASFIGLEDWELRFIGASLPTTLPSLSLEVV